MDKNLDWQARGADPDPPKVMRIRPDPDPQHWYYRQGVVLLPGATQLQAKDIAWRLKASQADCVVADPETAIKVSHSKKVSGFIFYTVQCF
jgi:hypothetical protein